MSLIPIQHDDFFIPLANSTAIADLNIPDELDTVFLHNVLGIANDTLAGPSNPPDDPLPHLIYLQIQLLLYYYPVFRYFGIPRVNRKFSLKYSRKERSEYDCLV